jgi:NAD(P)-dependent dehydrogenase (short-subunit alcohol dehydrogenase family)
MAMAGRVAGKVAFITGAARGQPEAERTREALAPRFGGLNLLPIPWVEAIDISNAVLWLASDESRYVTGVTLPIDAGLLIK